MSFRVHYEPEAELDILDAMHWYGEQHAGLEGDLLEAILDAEDVIQANPFLHAVKYRDIRWVHVKRFPYALHYFVDQDIVRVIGCIHFSRDPKIWPGA